MNWDKLKHQVSMDEAKRIIKTSEDGSLKKFYRVKTKVKNQEIELKEHLQKLPDEHTFSND